MSGSRTILTPQRLHVLRLLGEYHYISTPLFYRLLAIDPDDVHRRRAIRRVLFLLTKAGLVGRSRHVIDNPADRFLRYQCCYYFSRAGDLAIGGKTPPAAKAPALDLLLLSRG